jgi:hypothetical protein
MPSSRGVAEVVFVPGDDAVPVLFDQGDEVCDGLQAGAFRAGAPASEVFGCGAGVLVVEGVGSPCASAGPGRWPAGLRGASAGGVRPVAGPRGSPSSSATPQRVWVSSGRVVTSARRTVSMASLSVAGQGVTVEGHPRIRQVLADSADERGAPLGAGVGDRQRVTAVVGQVSGEASDGPGAASLGGEDHPAGVEVGDDADGAPGPCARRSPPSRPAARRCSRAGRGRRGA